ncbi:phage tail protein [Escherichia coli]|nr:phage tail protein [Escherichia coli]MCZ0224676.1 phage tail protein [Escherichia coli]MCZ0253639.1 phage tail protein [Escherichia coli]MCZ0316858.1 phage tail protein [Escherichia coli]MCZ0370644.1 phage tail protein [Escherichia coli]MCZ0407266.1 phage tail protein [Escherichia coli]
MCAEKVNNVITLTPDTSLPLLADVQYFELYSSDALNRKMKNIVLPGFYCGFEPVPGGGLTVRITSEKSDGRGAASVDVNECQISVQQIDDVIVPVKAGKTTIIVLEANYQYGVKTNQVDSSSKVSAARIIPLEGENRSDNQIEVCRVVVPAEATDVTADMIITKYRWNRALGIEFSSELDSDEELKAATPLAVKKLKTLIDTKAPIDSPELTGTPTAPTAAPSTNNNQIANTAFVRAAIAALVGSSPEALDTLNELAAALGNDPNFATTMTNALAGKQPLDATLTALAALATGANKLPYFTGKDTVAQTDLTSVGRDILAKTSTLAVIQYLGLRELGTSGEKIPLLSTANTWSARQTFNGGITGALTGNADTATKLKTAININGVRFDGSTDININTLVSRGRVTALGANAQGTSGIQLYEAYINGYPSPYGNVLHLKGATAAGEGELFIGWSGTSGDHAPVHIRSRRDTDSANWSEWAQVYTTAHKPTAKDVGAAQTFSASYNTGAGNWTTAEFIAWLKERGAFEVPYWMMKGSWSYADNKIITDTGVGNICLAGAVIEVLGHEGAMTIRVTTPTTTTGGGIASAQFTYINHGSAYAPAWRRDYNTTHKPTAADVGALPISGGTMNGVLTLQNVSQPLKTPGGGILANDGNLYINKSGFAGWIDELFMKNSGGTMSGQLKIRSTDGLRIYDAAYGMIFRRSENNFYLIPTAKDQGENGDIGSLRPFYVDLTNGRVTMGNGAVVDGGLGLGVGNTLGGNSIVLGDNDTGFKQNGDGILDVYANSQRVFRFQNGVAIAFKDIQAGDSKKFSLTSSNTSTKDATFRLWGASTRPVVAELGDDAGWHFYSQRNTDNSVIFSVNGQIQPSNWGNFDSRYVKDVRLGTRVVQLMARGGRYEIAGHAITGLRIIGEVDGDDEAIFRPIQKYINGTWYNVAQV